MFVFFTHGERQLCICGENVRFSDGFCVSQGQTVLWSQLSSPCSRWRNTPQFFCQGAPLHMLTIFTEQMPGSKQSCSCLCVQAVDSWGGGALSARLMCSQWQKLELSYYCDSSSVASVTAALLRADVERTMLVKFLDVFLHSVFVWNCTNEFVLIRTNHIE